MTLLQVADAINVKEATVQRYESGEIKNIKHETVTQLASLFGCSPSYLMGWSNDPYPGEPIPVSEDGLEVEAKRYFDALSPERRTEAVNYLRYLAESEDK
jgi:transcriptional regulator with XRE-family HTH domain